MDVLTSAGARTRTAAMGQRRVRVFYIAVACAVILTIFAGFARPYYLKAFTGAPPLAPFVHLHALVFTSWILLFLVQATLVAAHRTDLHRRLGVAVALLTLPMIPLGVATAIRGARHGRVPPGPYPDPLAFLVVPLGDVLLFTAFVAAGVVFRHRGEAHKRLMLLAALGGLLWPAIVRIPGVAGRPAAMFGLLALFLGATLVHDLAARGRLHPVTVWGSLLILGSFPLRRALAGTAAWHDLAAWLIR